MTDPMFFGYGSLVNLATHEYADPRPAHLAGWRRVWRHTSLRPVAFLSVEPCDRAEIAGVVARVPGGDWAALDEREAAYARRDVRHQVRHDGPSGDTAVYEVQAGQLAAPDAAHPILLSYLDVVVQGYHRMFGADGVAAFFETTEGWDAPVRNDRAGPMYPRAQRLLPNETALVDRHLEGLGIVPF